MESRATSNRLGRRIVRFVLLLAVLGLAGAVPAYFDSVSRRPPSASGDQTPAEVAFERALTDIDSLRSNARDRLLLLENGTSTGDIEPVVRAANSIRNIGDSERANLAEAVRGGKPGAREAALILSSADGCVNAARALDTLYQELSERAAINRASGKPTDEAFGLINAAQSRIAASISQAQDARPYADTVLAGNGVSSAVNSAALGLSAAFSELDAARGAAEHTRELLYR